MVKNNKVKIYNNSESTYQVTEGEKDKNGLLIVITIPPKTSVELSEKVAKQQLNNYPKDFLEGGSVQDQAKGLKEKDQRIVELEASEAAKEKAIVDLEDKLEASEAAKEAAEKETKDLNDLIDSAQAENKAPAGSKPGNK